MSAPGPTARAIPRVLSVAGTDPTGGAGIQADLKAIAATGGYGMAVVTALVAQNTQGVREVHVPPVAFLRAQLDAVSDDVAIDAVKLGMLVDAEVVGAVTEWLDRVRPGIVVLDPVMVATSGDRLLDADAEQAVRDLLPRADLVTPNLPELAVLVGEPEAADWPAALDQARRLAARHGVLVLAKGGHLRDPEDEPGPVSQPAALPDALVDPAGTVVEIAGDRVRTRHTHGTGCSMASALATSRARGRDWPDAVRETKAWLAESLRAADRLEVGHGRGPVSHLAGLWDRAGVHGTPDVAASDPSAATGPGTTDAAITDGWWEDIADVRADVDRCGVVTGLGDGTLDRTVFLRYLAQDALYLRDFARALTAASTLSPDVAGQTFWAGAARDTLVAELALHDAAVGSPDLAGVEPDAVTRAYVDHLLALAARGDHPALVAAVLPCFWIYDDVGRRLHARAAPGHPYEDWLATYDDPAFAATTARAIDLVGGIAARADADTRARMRRAFRISAEHELAFFVAPLRG